MFRRHDDCCDTCSTCDTCGTVTHVAPPPAPGKGATGKGAELVPAPKDVEQLKEMPKGDKSKTGVKDEEKKTPPNPKPEGDASLLRPVPSNTGLIVEQ
jgi:hypothetical protein